MVLSRGALIFSHSFCVLFSFWGFVGVFRSWCGCSLRGVGVGVCTHMQGGQERWSACSVFSGIFF